MVFNFFGLPAAQSCQFVFRGGIRIVRAIAAIRAAGTQCALPLPVLEATQNCEEKNTFLDGLCAFPACLLGCWLLAVRWMDGLDGWTVGTVAVSGAS